MNIGQQRVSEETLKEFYFSLTHLINEYLHSFRDEKHKTQLISQKVIETLRSNFMEYMKTCLDMAADLILLEQEEKNAT